MKVTVIKTYLLSIHSILNKLDLPDPLCLSKSKHLQQLETFLYVSQIIRLLTQF